MRRASTKATSSRNGSSRTNDRPLLRCFGFAGWPEAGGPFSGGSDGGASAPAAGVAGPSVVTDECSQGPWGWPSPDGPGASEDCSIRGVDDDGWGLGRSGAASSPWPRSGPTAIPLALLRVEFLSRFGRRRGYDRFTKFSNPGAFAAALPQVIQLGSANPTAGDDLDLGDGRRVHGIGPLYANPEGHLANGEGLP